MATLEQHEEWRTLKFPQNGPPRRANRLPAHSNRSGGDLFPYSTRCAAAPDFDSRAGNLLPADRTRVPRTFQEKNQSS